MLKSVVSLKRLMGVALLGALAALLTGCNIVTPDHPQSTFDTLGPVAANQLFIFWVIFWAGVVVFIAVEAALIYMVFKFKRRDDRDPAQTHGNTRLEITWTIVPVIVLIVAAVPTVIGIFYADAGRFVSADTKGRYLEIDAIGHQWWFEFRYPHPTNPGEQIAVANEIYIPVGEPVVFLLDSVDVIHSFWVPKLGGKVDMIPNNDNMLWYQADAPGEYYGQCVEFCGVSHANMRFKVVAVLREEFDAWLLHQANPALEPSDALAAQGKKLFRDAGCSGCHADSSSVIKLRDDGSRIPGRTGPILTHVATRLNHLGIYRNSDVNFEDARGSRQLYVNSAGIPTDLNTGRPFVNESMLQNNLKVWITDPEALKPGNLMSRDGEPYIDPANELTEQEIDALVAYLMTLK
jgi:cytochrome c oxidase subunit 2